MLFPRLQNIGVYSSATHPSIFITSFFKIKPMSGVIQTPSRSLEGPGPLNSMRCIGLQQEVLPLQLRRLEKPAIRIMNSSKLVCSRPLLTSRREYDQSIRQLPSRLLELSNLFKMFSGSHM